VKRRDFITLLGGAAAAWPLAARAQHKLPTIGFLGALTPADSREWIDAFVERLRQLGWIEGHTVAIEYRWAGGRFDSSADMLAEFVRHEVDVIVTQATANVLAAKRTTSVIPIVFASAGDPVGNGIVASLAKPGGNITGMSVLSTDLAGKRLEVLREVVTPLRRVAVLANPGNPIATLEMGEVQAAARTLGLEVIPVEVRKTEDLAPAFAALGGRADALYVPADPIASSNRSRISDLAVGARLPAIFASREYARAGGLLSYGINWPNLFRRTAELVDKVLRGTKPADIPVEQPTQFELVINLKTAKALGLAVPPTVLARADEVIE
jgi:putative ABC transport system substrate-binding protein